MLKSVQVGIFFYWTICLSGIVFNRQTQNCLLPHYSLFLSYSLFLRDEKNLVFPWLLISNYRPNTTPWICFSVVFVFNNDDNNDMRISLDKICCQVLISWQLHLDFQWQLTMNQRGKSLQELRDIFSQCDVDSDGRLKATVG